jgi:hypothetical protein
MSRAFNAKLQDRSRRDHQLQPDFYITATHTTLGTLFKSPDRSLDTTTATPKLPRYPTKNHPAQPPP